MSAPSIAYLDEELIIKKGGTTEAYQLPLSNYSGNIKTLFYLDFIMVCDKSSTGYIGMIEDNSSLLNYKQHNPSRFGSIRAKRKSNGKIYIALLDAGLNTRAYVTSQTGVTAYIGDFKVNGEFLSAFYSENTVVGVRYRIAYEDSTYGSWIEDSEVDSSGEAPSSTFDFDIRLRSVSLSNVGFNSTIEWHIYIENEEGRYIFPTTEEQSVALIPIQFRLSPSGSPNTYYTNTPEENPVIADGAADANLVTQIFTSTDGLAPYLPYFGNLYLNSNPDYLYVFGTATVSGDERINYLLSITDTGTPSVSWIPIYYIGYGSTTTQACNKAALGDGVTYYINSVTLKVHATINGAYPPNRYYIDFNDENNYRIIQITDGIRSDTGSTCSI